MIVKIFVALFILHSRIGDCRRNEPARTGDFCRGRAFPRRKKRGGSGAASPVARRPKFAVGIARVKDIQRANIIPRPSSKKNDSTPNILYTLLPKKSMTKILNFSLYKGGRFRTFRMFFSSNSPRRKHDTLRMIPGEGASFNGNFSPFLAPSAPHFQICDTISRKFVLNGQSSKNPLCPRREGISSEFSRLRVFLFNKILLIF